MNFIVKFAFGDFCIVEGVDYTNGYPVGDYSGKTLKQLDYYSSDPFAQHKILNVESIRQLQRFKYRAGCVIEVTEDHWWDLYECLPPADWETGVGFIVFRCIELITGDLATWGVKLNGKHFFIVENEGFGAFNMLNKVKKHLGVAICASMLGVEIVKPEGC